MAKHEKKFLFTDADLIRLVKFKDPKRIIDVLLGGDDFDLVSNERDFIESFANKSKKLLTDMRRNAKNYAVKKTRLTQPRMEKIVPYEVPPIRDIENEDTFLEYTNVLQERYDLISTYNDRCLPLPTEGSEDYDLYALRGRYQWVADIFEKRKGQPIPEFDSGDVDYEPEEELSDSESTVIKFRETYVPQYYRQFELDAEHLSGNKQHPHWDMFEDFIEDIRDNYRGLPRKEFIRSVNLEIEKSQHEKDWHVLKWMEDNKIPEFHEYPISRSDSYLDQYNIYPHGAHNPRYDFFHRSFAYMTINADITTIEEMIEYANKLRHHDFFDFWADWLKSIHETILDTEDGKHHRTKNPVSKIPTNLLHKMRRLEDGTWIKV